MNGMHERKEQQAIERTKRIIELCGGVENVCRATGRSRVRVYSWTYPKDRHGSGGMIPPQCQQDLMAYAREHGLPLAPEHFFPARDEEDAA